MRYRGGNSGTSQGKNNDATKGYCEFNLVDSARKCVLKIYDPENNLKIDVTLNNQLAVRNSLLIRRYVEMCENVKTLLLLVKLWSKENGIVLNGTRNGYLSSYAYVLTVLVFL